MCVFNSTFKNAFKTNEFSTFSPFAPTKRTHRDQNRDLLNKYFHISPISHQFCKSAPRSSSKHLFANPANGNLCKKLCASLIPPSRMALKPSVFQLLRLSAPPSAHTGIKTVISSRNILIFPPFHINSAKVLPAQAANTFLQIQQTAIYVTKLCASVIPPSNMPL